MSYCGFWLTGAKLQDLPSSMSEVEVAEELGLGKVSARPHRVQPVSATTGDGIASGLQWIVAAVKASPRLSLLRRKMRGA
jgi:ADP-ribosylation factor family